MLLIVVWISQTGHMSIGISIGMSVDTVRSLHDVAAVLAYIALAGTVLMVAARIIPSVTSVRFLAAIYRFQLPLAALVATTAMAGSFF